MDLFISVILKYLIFELRFEKQLLNKMREHKESIYFKLIL